MKILNRYCNLPDVEFGLSIRETLHLAQMEKKFPAMAKIHDKEKILFRLKRPMQF